MMYENGPFIYIEIPNEDTGIADKRFVPLPLLFDRIWEEYIRGMIPDDYCRGILRDIELSEVEVFNMMERLQLGKAEWDSTDYRERCYI